MELNDQSRQEILDCIRGNRKIEAIKLYRDATGAGLKESKEFIEELTRQLQADDPNFTPQKAGCAAVVLALLMLSWGTVLLTWNMV